MKTSIRILMICTLALACGAIESRAAECSLQKADWSAWIDKMPPTPDAFYVVGRITLPSPGHVARLAPAVPQGTTDTTLILKLEVKQESEAASVMTPGIARYDLNPYSGKPLYSAVTIHSGLDCSITIDVTTAH